ncbi:MAG: hypothetical protein ACRD3W_01965 [Terriglobales bacterium]
MQHVSFWELAKELGVNIDTIRRNVKRLGLRHQSLVTSTSKGSRVQHLSIEDSQILRMHFEKAGTQEALEESEIDQGNLFQRFGYFYLIQLIPEALPNRFKIGFTDNMEKRLGEHQTAAPTARLIRNWRCKRCWDQAAMDSITREGCSLVMNEVYEGDLHGFIERGDAFFSQLPCEYQIPDLSPHSPLLKKEPIECEPELGVIESQSVK